MRRRFLLLGLLGLLGLVGVLGMVSGSSAAPAATGDVWWTNSAANTIGRASLDGTGVDQSFISGASVPTQIAVDAGHVYWANFSSNTIGRANLDGTGVNQSFIGGAIGPYGVAVDAGHVYWANRDANTIGRASLDGTGVDQSFISGASTPVDVAVDAGYVYWTNPYAGTIGRANLDGTGVDQSFIGGASGPRGVAVDQVVVATYVLSTNASPAAGGTVTGGGTYNSGTVVTVAQSPNAGYAFTGWSGDCTGTGACSVTMDAAKSVTANYGRTPATADSCKKDGWRSLVAANGASFKNQGDCVSYVATNGKNGPNG